MTTICKDIISIGNYSTIYSEYNNDLEVVVKVYSLFSKKSQNAFFKELYAYKLLGNNNKKRICENINNYTESQYGYIFMKKYNCDLHDYIFNRNIMLSHKDIIDIFKKICKSVAILHKKGIAHLGIKLENILVDIKSNEFVLTDFTCSLFFNTSEISINQYCESSSSSPYSNNDKSINPFKIDIYNLGILLFILLTKTYPKIHNKTKICIFNDNINIPLKIQSFLKLLLSPNYKNRPTIKQILKSSLFKQSTKSLILSRLCVK